MSTDLAGKRLAIMGSDNAVEDVVRYCRLHGITLISFGNNPNALMHKLSDRAHLVNCTDENIMIPLLKEERIDGVFSATAERVIRSCAKYLPRVGLRYYTNLKQWDTLMNKALFKEYAKVFGINTVPAYSVNYEKNKVIEDMKFPLVVKPADGCGSIGISVCNSVEEVENAIQEVKEISQYDKVICEKYLTGRFFSLYTCIQNGKLYFPYVKERIFYPPVGKHPEQPFLDIVPASFADIIKESLCLKIEQLLLSLDIQNGECWFQGILEDGVPYLMDNGFRISGSRDWKTIEEETGIDLIESYIKFALTGCFGGDFSSFERPVEHSYAMIAIGLKNGVIGRISGIDHVVNMPCVADYHQYYTEGSRITSSGILSQTFFRALIKANNRDELKESICEILPHIQVLDENGNSLLLDYPEAFYQWINE